MELLGGQQERGLGALCPLSIPCPSHFFHLLFLSGILYHELIIVDIALS